MSDECYLCFNVVLCDFAKSLRISNRSSQGRVSASASASVDFCTNAWYGYPVQYSAMQGDGSTTRNFC